MVIGDLAVFDYHMMGKYTSHRLVETTADGLLWNREIVPRSGATNAYLAECLVDTM